MDRQCVNYIKPPATTRERGVCNEFNRNWGDVKGGPDESGLEAAGPLSLNRTSLKRLNAGRAKRSLDNRIMPAGVKNAKIAQTHFDNQDDPGDAEGDLPHLEELKGRLFLIPKRDELAGDGRQCCSSDNDFIAARIASKREGYILRLPHRDRTS